MENYPKDSYGSQENKNFSVARIVMAALFVVVHVVCFIVSQNRLGVIHEYPYLWVVPALSLIATVYIIFKTGTDSFENTPWPYIIGIILLVASAVCLTYCPQC